MSDGNVVEVRVDHLVVDPTVQPRMRGVTQQHVALLHEGLAAGTLPPITVTPRRDGQFVVIDGAHRLEAYRKAGVKTVPARVVEAAGYWEAFCANRDHGLPLTIEDRKRAAVWLKQHRPELSVRAIAKEVGLAVSTVQGALCQRRRIQRGGGLAVQRPDPWRRFLRALAQLYERRGDDPRFVDSLAQDLVDLVEGTSDPGLVWDALLDFVAAVERAWELTEHLYPEEGTNNTPRASSRG
ncbi:MAG: ParB N-terminal domain-containing protein [Armatimonadota bacterium]|nr:ParB N-terminal domain-containing protein [Armatimonadota bacterium]